MLSFQWVNKPNTRPPIWHLKQHSTTTATLITIKEEGAKLSIKTCAYKTIGYNYNTHRDNFGTLSLLEIGFWCACDRLIVILAWVPICEIWLSACSRREKIKPPHKQRLRSNKPLQKDTTKQTWVCKLFGRHSHCQSSQRTSVLAILHSNCHSRAYIPTLPVSAFCRRRWYIYPSFFRSEKTRDICVCVLSLIHIWRCRRWP